MSSAMVTIVCLAMGKLVPVRADRIKQLAEPARLRRLPAARSALLLTTPTTPLSLSDGLTWALPDQPNAAMDSQAGPGGGASSRMTAHWMTP
jgi:hypothetical protein